MPRYLVINGPNLNLLGSRDPATYGSMTLAELEKRIEEKAGVLGVEVECFQSNSEGAIIDYIQQNRGLAQGILINPGGLTHYGYSLRDALTDTNVPIIEVHLSNIYAREEWRRRSVIAPIAMGQVTGLGWQGYLAALDVLAATMNEGR